VQVQVQVQVQVGQAVVKLRWMRWPGRMQQHGAVSGCQGSRIEDGTESRASGEMVRWDGWPGESGPSRERSRASSRLSTVTSHSFFAAIHIFHALSRLFGGRTKKVPW
jgi:hypothetical protein